jgi:hypothetical protein
MGVCAGIAEALSLKLNLSVDRCVVTIVVRICVAVKIAGFMWLEPGLTVQNLMRKFLQIRNGVTFATGSR